LDDAAVYYLVDTVPDPGQFNAFTILVSSPRKNNYKQFEKYMDVVVYIMPVWEKMEIDVIYDIKYKSTMKIEDLNTKFNLFNGVPRFIFDTTMDHESKQNAACAVADLDKCLRAHDSFDSDQDVSHYIIQMVPYENYTKYRTCFLSNTVSQKVLSRYQKDHRQKLVEFLEDSLSPDFAPSLSTFRGDVFENVTHTLLAKGGKFQTFGPLGNPDAKIDTITIPRCFPMSVSNFQNTPANIYYRPTSSKFPVIDSWIGNIGFLQISTTKHKRKGLNFYHMNNYMSTSIRFKAVHNKFYLVIPKERFDKEMVLREPLPFLENNTKTERRRKIPKNIRSTTIEKVIVNPEELQQYLLVIEIKSLLE